MLDPATIDRAPGIGWCRAWTAQVDAHLAAGLSQAARQRPVALLALGGYARGELCPASDIDLLLLHDGWPERDLKRLVEAVCYPLWDAGLSVGHAVRTPKEAVRAAGGGVDTATALTDRRLVAGDEGLADDLRARARRWLRRSGGEVLAGLAAADQQRHRAAGAHPGFQEPDLKSGAGGLRDVHSLRWAAACVLGEAGLDALVGARYLSAIDRGELAQAAGDLLAARCALHLQQGRNARDVLRLDLQDAVAERLGLADGDVLLQRVGLAARLIAHVHGRTWAPLLADATEGRRRRHPVPVALDDGVALVDGLVEAAEDRTLATEPSLGLRTVAAAAHAGTHLGRGTAERFRRELAPGGGAPGGVALGGVALGGVAPGGVALGWDEAGRVAIVRALRAGARGVGALQDADHVGLLAAHLPEWPLVRGRPQRNPFHRFDLDTHGIEAACELVAIADGGDGPALAELFAGIADQDALLLGTWLHDVGKAWPGDHSTSGADVAARWVRHMGFGERRAAVVGQLVLHHLLLPDAATRRDIDDQDEVAAVAREVGDVALLDALYLLTLSDSRATGPSAHSPWKDGLIAELHGRARGVLAEDPTARTAAFDPTHAARAAEEQARRQGVDPTAVRQLLHGLGERYLLAASPAQCAAHAALLLPLPAAGEVRAAWRAGDAEGTHVLSVVAWDRLGFMADCAGVLAGWGLRVLDARAFTCEAEGEPALALDWFVVSAGAELDGAAVVRDLRAVVRGDVAVADLLARRESRRDVRPRPLAAPLPVQVRFDVGPRITRIEVTGPDAPGVLSRLAGTLASAGLGVIGARVSTLGPEVRDVFFLRTPSGPPEEGWEGLEARLRAAAGWPARTREQTRAG